MTMAEGAKESMRGRIGALQAGMDSKLDTITELSKILYRHLVQQHPPDDAEDKQKEVGDPIPDGFLPRLITWQESRALVLEDIITILEQIAREVE